MFNEAMMGLTETVNANGIVQLQYRSLGARKESASPVQMPIFHRTALSWDDDRRAAAFVSPRDSAARIFARYVATAVEANLKSGGALSAGNVPLNVTHAIALFEALRLYGITYIVDPDSSYIALSDDASALDNLYYPYMTLSYRGGDCDDLSILFCSLLEALNIESAFITVPGHIYVAFEVGNDSWQASSGDIIEIEGKRWLPLEITVPNRGFSQAWRIGARQWRNAGEEAVLLPIRECWSIYPPVTVPGSGERPPEMPGWEEITTAAAREQGAR
jgi:transglutaminase-like putative cysteine protease